MRRIIVMILVAILSLTGCISSTSTSPKKNYRLPRESMRKQFGTHAELAMILAPAETVRRKLRKEIAGDDGVHPDYAKKFDAMIATFNDSVVENTLVIVLKDYFTEQEALALADYLAEGEGQKAINTLNEQLIDFDPKKPGPAPIIAKALGTFSQNEVGKKLVRLSPKVQQEFTKMIKALSIQETRRIIKLDIR